MDTSNFSKWHKWLDRSQINNLNYPGVYVLSYSEEDISNVKFSFIEDIIYVGVTNSLKGLKSRLKQFDDTIKNLDLWDIHGGAERVRFAYRDYIKLISKLYVSIYFFKCDVGLKKAEDLRIMGEVVKLEYDCFAEYVEKYGILPRFNDMKRSPKK
ncbi:MAG: hypothetical protein L0Y79_09465 [Chlorobi bacterium]|nr:hypothetical protein [Chlorobiota bacterium]MCI0716143.1 hypothetical protein [Chlorobiota bacterium]